jgi:hypothetical protein
LIALNITQELPQTATIVGKQVIHHVQKLNEPSSLVNQEKDSWVGIGVLGTQNYYKQI